MSRVVLGWMAWPLEIIGIAAQRPPENDPRAFHCDAEPEDHRYRPWHSLHLCKQRYLPNETIAVSGRPLDLNLPQRHQPFRPSSHVLAIRSRQPWALRAR